MFALKAFVASNHQFHLKLNSLPVVLQLSTKVLWYDLVATPTPDLAEARDVHIVHQPSGKNQ